MRRWIYLETRKWRILKSLVLVLLVLLALCGGIQSAKKHQPDNTGQKQNGEDEDEGKSLSHGKRRINAVSEALNSKTQETVMELSGLTSSTLNHTPTAHYPTNRTPMSGSHDTDEKSTANPATSDTKSMFTSDSTTTSTRPTSTATDHTERSAIKDSSTSSTSPQNPQFTETPPTRSSGSSDAAHLTTGTSPETRQVQDTSTTPVSLPRSPDRATSRSPQTSSPPSRSVSAETETQTSALIMSDSTAAKPTCGRVVNPSERSQSTQSVTKLTTSGQYISETAGLTESPSTGGFTPKTESSEFPQISPSLGPGTTPRSTTDNQKPTSGRETSAEKTMLPTEKKSTSGTATAASETRGSNSEITTNDPSPRTTRILSDTTRPPMDTPIQPETSQFTQASTFGHPDKTEQPTSTAAPNIFKTETTTTTDKTSPSKVSTPSSTSRFSPTSTTVSPWSNSPSALTASSMSASPSTSPWTTPPPETTSQSSVSSTDPAASTMGSTDQPKSTPLTPNRPLSTSVNTNTPPTSVSTMPQPPTMFSTWSTKPTPHTTTSVTSIDTTDTPAPTHPPVTHSARQTPPVTGEAASSSSRPQTPSPMTSSSRSSTSWGVWSTAMATTLASLPSAVSSLVSTSSTSPQCSDCQCNGGRCKFNVTAGKCECQCQGHVFGDQCSLGTNQTSAGIDTGTMPTRKANLALKVDTDYLEDFKNLSSPRSQDFIKRLEQELEVLCKQADPQNYKRVKVTKLSPGSVVADSVAEYNYPNNDSQIHFLNSQLDEVLTEIFNDAKNQGLISQAFGNKSVALNEVSLQPPPIKNITGLEPYLHCSGFANYTAQIINGHYQCVGPCQTNPAFCSEKGECQNDIYKGPVCIGKEISPSTTQAQPTSLPTMTAMLSSSTEGLSLSTVTQSRESTSPQTIVSSAELRSTSGPVETPSESPQSTWSMLTFTTNEQSSLTATVLSNATSFTPITEHPSSDGSTLTSETSQLSQTAIPPITEPTATANIQKGTISQETSAETMSSSRGPPSPSGTVETSSETLQSTDSNTKVSTNDQPSSTTEMEKTSTSQESSTKTMYSSRGPPSPPGTVETSSETPQSTQSVSSSSTNDQSNMTTRNLSETTMSIDNTEGPSPSGPTYQKQTSQPPQTSTPLNTGTTQATTTERHQQATSQETSGARTFSSEPQSTSGTVETTSETPQSPHFNTKIPPTDRSSSTTETEKTSASQETSTKTMSSFTERQSSPGAVETSSEGPQSTHSVTQLTTNDQSSSSTTIFSQRIISTENTEHPSTAGWTLNLHTFQSSLPPNTRTTLPPTSETEEATSRQQTSASITVFSTSQESTTGPVVTSSDPLPSTQSTSKVTPDDQSSLATTNPSDTSSSTENTEQLSPAGSTFRPETSHFPQTSIPPNKETTPSSTTEMEKASTNQETSAVATSPSTESPPPSGTVETSSDVPQSTQSTSTFTTTDHSSSTTTVLCETTSSTNNTTHPSTSGSGTTSLEETPPTSKVSTPSSTSRFSPTSTTVSPWSNSPSALTASSMSASPSTSPWTTPPPETTSQSSVSSTNPAASTMESTDQPKSTPLTPNRPLSTSVNTNTPPTSVSTMPQPPTMFSTWSTKPTPHTTTSVTSIDTTDTVTLTPLLTSAVTSTDNGTPMSFLTTSVRPSLNTAATTQILQRTTHSTRQTFAATGEAGTETSSSRLESSPSSTLIALTPSEGATTDTTAHRSTPSNPTHTNATTPPTTPQCSDCQCNGGSCIFNGTLGVCQCQCANFVSGGQCTLGENNIPVNIDTAAIPTRQANLTLKINVTYDEAFNNLSSPQSLVFINKLEEQLDALCKQAEPQAYKTVKVTKLSSGSVVADSVAVYNYPNNENQIHFINTQLEGKLIQILNDTTNLVKISQAFGNGSIELNGVAFQAPPIRNISNLEAFVNCSGFANYTAEIVDGQWQCVGPCKTKPGYCNQHGQCRNHVLQGPVCDCYQNILEQYHGPRCDLLRRGPAFYGALFGSLAGAVLLLILIVIVAIVVKNRRRHSSRLLDFEEDFCDFTDKGKHGHGLAGNYSSRGFRPQLANVDTRFPVVSKHPELSNIKPR